MSRVYDGENDYLINDSIVEVQLYHGIIINRFNDFVIPGKEKSSMRNYDNMTDEEFISAYESPFSSQEKDEMHEEALKQYNEGRVREFNDELIDELFADETV